MDAFSSADRLSLIARLLQRLNLRFPSLFLLLAALTLADILIPDAIPFVDEIGLAVLTLLVALWKDRRTHSRAEFTRRPRRSGPAA
mgnify:CR=1 FL=1